MTSGVGWCGGYLNYAPGKITWDVRNTTHDGCATGEDSDVTGDGYSLDAHG
jgi:hypothetical protein